MNRKAFSVLLGFIVCLALWWGVLQAAEKAASTSGKPFYLKGKVERVLKVKGGTERNPVEGAMVMLLDVPVRLAREFQSTAMMDQVKKKFVPHLLPVVIRQEVMFLNSDNFSHNVQLVRIHTGSQPAREFLLNAFTEPQAHATYTPRKPGVIQVHCNMHPSMLAFLVVQADPYLYARTNDSGQFSLPVPRSIPGRTYELRVWSEDLGYTPVKRVEIQEGMDIRTGLDFSY